MMGNITLTWRGSFTDEYSIVIFLSLSVVNNLDSGIWSRGTNDM